MTDNEIIKALECCYKDGCKECPLWECKGDCFEELIKHNVLDLINRQKAEIEKFERIDHFAQKTIALQTAEIKKLEAEIERLQAMVEREREKYEITMDKLKETLENGKVIYTNPMGRYDPYTDSFVKEMVGLNDL